MKKLAIFAVFAAFAVSLMAGCGGEKSAEEANTQKEGATSAAGTPTDTATPSEE